MSDLAVIVTGLVGAAGIAGALLSAGLTARWQLVSLKVGIAAENERARLAEKRRIYAQFLGSSVNVRLAIIYNDLLANSDQPTSELTDRITATMSEWANRGYEVALIAPKNVGDLVETSVKLLYDEYDESQQRMFGKAIDALTEAMRADLGEPPIDTAEALVPGLVPDGSRAPAP
jgi:hypothetical protein